MLSISTVYPKLLTGKLVAIICLNEYLKGHEKIYKKKKKKKKKKQHLKQTQN